MLSEREGCGLIGFEAITDDVTRWTFFNVLSTRFPFPAVSSCLVYQVESSSYLLSTLHIYIYLFHLQRHFLDTGQWQTSTLCCSIHLSSFAVTCFSFG